MAHNRVFPGVGFKSHMPFFDGKMLLFCRSDEPVRREFQCGGQIWQRMRTNKALARRFRDLKRTRSIQYRAWKLFYTTWKQREPKRLDTGLPDEALECSPTFYRQDGKLHVSFVGGIPGSERIRYRLYKMVGPSWKKLSQAKPALSRATRIGCIGPDYIVCSRGRAVVVLAPDRTRRCILECPLERVLRVSFRAEHQEELLITGRAGDGSSCTLLYRLGSDETLEVRSSQEVYKPTLFGDRMVSAKRSDGGFEDRELWHGEYELVKAKQAIRRKA